MAVALLGGIGFQLAVPQLLRQFIDAALEGTPASELTQLGGLFLLVALTHQALALTATWLSANVGWSATNRMREDMTTHCLDLDMSFHHRHTPGEMIERIDGDITSLSNFFSQFIVHIIGNLILTAGILVFLFRESLLVGSVLTVFTVLSFALLFQMRRIAVPAMVRQRAASSHLFGFMEEKMSAIEDIRANGGGDFVMRRFYEANHEFFHTTRTSWMLRVVVWMTIMGILFIGNILALGFGHKLYSAGTITAGTVVLFFYYIEMLRTPIERITRQIEDFQNAGAGLERANELLCEQPGLTFPDSGPNLDLPLEIDFQDVSFAYQAPEFVLKHIDLRLHPGRSLGLLGRTGSGKTTLARLLFRLYDPSEGEIRFNGILLSDLPRATLRASIGLVTQDVQIFRGTIRDNIRFFDPDIHDSQILSVLDKLGLQAWLASRPEGLDTPLDAGAATLSAGEAQLLACARVFLKDPGLLILDEPTSRMDPATEQLVRKALHHLMNGRTTLVIAHRLSTVDTLDDILILEDGRIVEYGPREDLKNRTDSRFAQLLRTGLEEAT